MVHFWIRWLHTTWKRVKKNQIRGRASESRSLISTLAVANKHLRLIQKLQEAKILNSRPLMNAFASLHHDNRKSLKMQLTIDEDSKSSSIELCFIKLFGIQRLFCLPTVTWGKTNQLLIKREKYSHYLMTKKKKNRVQKKKHFPATELLLC